MARPVGRSQGGVICFDKPQINRAKKRCCCGKVSIETAVQRQPYEVQRQPNGSV